MKKNIELSVYELGLIRSSLRERMITLEDFRVSSFNNNMDDDDQAEMNSDIDSFKLELSDLNEKVKFMAEIQMSNAELHDNKQAS